MVAVAVSGELSPAALLAVAAAGGVVTAVALVRRAGAGSPEVGRPLRVPVVLVAAAAAVELVALARDDLPTLSDLLDPVLAHPVARAAATAGWLATGAWLATRPNGEPGARRPAHLVPAARMSAAPMRTTTGRLAVLAVWLWSGVHFLAR